MGNANEAKVMSLADRKGYLVHVGMDDDGERVAWYGEAFAETDMEEERPLFQTGFERSEADVLAGVYEWLRRAPALRKAASR